MEPLIKGVTRKPRELNTQGELSRGAYYECKNPACGLVFYTEIPDCKVRCPKCMGKSLSFHTIGPNHKL